MSEEGIAKARGAESAPRDVRRRFEQWAKNPRCEANAVSAVHGIAMESVARAEGIPPSTGQSPFALSRGQRFEAGILKDGALRLRKELAFRGLFPSEEAEFVDFRLHRYGGPHRTPDEAREATTAWIEGLARDGARAGLAPVVAAGPALALPVGVMLPEAMLVVDVLLALRDGGPGGDQPVRLVVGEVKTYPDRGGYTDGGELAQARAQAGVYVHALREVLGGRRAAGRIEVPDEGFLVLSQPGSNGPSVRAGEDLRYQAQRAERGFAQLRDVAREHGRAGAGVEDVTRAGTSYSQECLAFCDRAPGCFRKALEEGDPVVLGEDVARFLGPVRLGRALELMAGAKPEGPAEKDLVERMGVP